MAEKVPFTMARLQSIPAPSSGRVYVYDSKTPGLAMCTTENGTKTFYLYKKVHGRPVRVRIGRFPELSVDQAREVAHGLAGEIAKGINPQAERRKMREGTTLGELFTYYLDHHAKVYKRAWGVDKRNYDNHLKAWESRRISDIQYADIQALHARIGEETGHYAANRVVSLLSKMFNEAKSIGFSGANPARGIRKFREESRERFLLPEEMPRFIKALEDEPDETIRDLVWMCLLTGARRGNVQAMQWAHINIEAGIWTIPATRAKAGYALTVHLPEKAVEILKQRLASRGKSDYVFPGRGKSGHIVEPKMAWKAMLKRAGIADLRMHDLRRTLGSWQVATGASLSVIGKSLGHRNIATTQIYARLQLDPVRQSVDKATAAMLAAEEPKKKRKKKAE